MKTEYNTSEMYLALKNWKKTIKETMRKRKWTYNHISQITNINESNIHSILNSGNPTLETMIKITEKIEYEEAFCDNLLF